MSDQAEMQSPTVEQRIVGSLFDQPVKQPEQQAPEETQSTEPEFEEVEYEGERFQVPPKLKKGLMLNEDYTRKTQEVAERRVAIENSQKQLQLVEQQHAFRDSTKADYEQLGMIEAYLQQPRDWNTMSVEDMLRTRAEIDGLKDRRDQMRSSLTEREKAFMQEISTQQEALHNSVQEFMGKKVPGWSKTAWTDVSEWALSQGFTNEEVKSITNPVHAETLWKARQFDKLQASKDSAVKQASGAAPMAKPGSANPMPQEVKDKFAFNKALKSTAHGSFEQKQLVENRLGSLFRKR